MLLEKEPCALDQKAHFLGDFADRRAWTLLGKQQRFDEGLISEMA